MSVRRSSRLMLKNKGASIPDNTTVKMYGYGLGYNSVSKYSQIQSLSVSFYWREKDYGDEVLEGWYFTMQGNTNIQMPYYSSPSFSFWRNYVYFTPTHIFFGYYNSTLCIYKKGNQAILRQQLLTSVGDYGGEYILSASFEHVVAIMKAGLTDNNSTVRDSAVYSFPIGEVKVQWMDQHTPPKAHFSFVA
jgi:hypothetical protein